MADLRRMLLSPISLLLAGLVLSALTVFAGPLAAVAGAGVVLQERALRRKQPTAFTRSLPAIVEGERLQTALLLGVEIVLGLTLVTGVVLNREEGLAWLTADHKTVLSLLDLAWEPGEDCTGRILLTFAGDGALAVSVECLNVDLRDVTRPYAAPSGKAPNHGES